MEIGDVFVVNKADRPGADKTVTEVTMMMSLVEEHRGTGSRRSSSNLHLPSARRYICSTIDEDPVAVLFDQRHHHRDLGARSCRHRAIGLVDDEDVADLHDPGLDGLDVVAHARDEDHEVRLHGAHDLDLVLPHADGLDQHDVEARGVEHIDGIVGRPGQHRRESRAWPSSG